MANKDLGKEKVYQRKYYEENRERILARQRQYYKKNREARKTYQCRYRKSNFDKISAAHRKYYWKNLDKQRSYYRRMKRKRRYLKNKMLLYDPCSYCGNKAEAIDHIVPVFDDGPSSWDNLTAACKACNSSKGHKPMMLWLLKRHQADAEIYD